MSPLPLSTQGNWCPSTHLIWSLRSDHSSNLPLFCFPAVEVAEAQSEQDWSNFERGRRLVECFLNCWSSCILLMMMVRECTMMFWFKCGKTLRGGTLTLAQKPRFSFSPRYRRQFRRAVHRTALGLNATFPSFFCESSHFAPCHHHRLALETAQEAVPSLRGDNRGCSEARK